MAMRVHLKGNLRLHLVFATLRGDHPDSIWKRFACKERQFAVAAYFALMALA